MTLRNLILTIFLGGVLSASPCAQAENLLITQVELEGVTVLNQNDVESTLQIGPGDALDRVRVVETEKAILELYRYQGYEKARIGSKLVRTSTGLTLVFQVVEGLPTRILGLKLKVSDRSDPQLVEKLSQMFSINRGEVYAQETVSNLKRQITETLASQEFIGAMVSASEATIVSAGLSDDDKKNADHWVQLELSVDPGHKTSFGFRGNQFFKREDFEALIKEQRASGFGADYVENIRKLLLDLYLKNGFLQTQVKAFPFEKPEKGIRHITYWIEEGPRIRIERIEFDGNRVFSSEELLREFLDRAPPLIQTGYYNFKEIERTSELLLQWVRSKGYLAAKLVTITPQFDPKTLRTLVKIYVFEGDQTILQSVQIHGLKAIDENEVLKTLGVREGIPLNLYQFSDGLEKLKGIYRNKGYLSFQITNETSDHVVTYSDENRFASISLDFLEGPLFRVSQVRIDSPISTKEHVIIREMVLKPGDICEEYKVTLSESNLRRLGIFSQAQIRIIDDPEKPDFKILSLFITEGSPGIAAVGTGLRNDLGVRAFGQLAYTNLLNRNHTVSLTVNTNRRIPQFWPQRLPLEYQAQLDYIWPWFLGDKTRVRPSVRLDRTQYLNFDVVGSTYSMNLDRPLLERPNLAAGFTYQIQKIRQFNAIATVDNQRLLIGSIIPSIRLDLRDDPLAPTRGFYFWTSYEVSNRHFGSQVDPYEVGYTRWQMRTDYTFSLPKGISFYVSFRTGIQRSTVAPKNPDDPTDPSGSIPLIKQFVLGGPTSLRGFRDQELNLQDKLIRGLASYVNYRTQLDLPFSGGLKWGPFLDAGNLLVDHYSFGILRYGTGLGFRYNTPVGPVNFDWGFKVKPRPGESPYQFNFSIGLM